MLLALASLFVFDPFDIAGPLNALLYGLNVFVVALWIKQNVHSKFLVIWGCLATALSLPLTGLATTVLSETPFILFISLSLLQIEKHTKTGRYHALMWSAAFAGIAFSIRYAGAALVISILLLLILQRNVAFLKKTKRLLVFGLISTIPAASWFARNIYLTGKFSNHASPNRDFLEIANGVFSVLAEWSIPLARIGYPLRGGGEDISPGIIVTGMIILSVLTVVVVSLLVFRQKFRDNFSYHGFCAFGLFVSGYVSFLITSMLWGAGVGQFGVEPRYLAPIYIPCLLTALPLIDRFSNVGHCKPIGRNIARLGFIARLILVLWLASHILPHAKIIRDINEGSWSSLGYAKRDWVSSDILQYIRETPITGNMVSGNYIALVYLYANQWQTYDGLPWDFPGLTRWVEAAEEGTHIVWFTCCDWGHGYGIDELREIDGLNVVITTKDGILFETKAIKALPKDG